jgi:hypothetical protein
MTAAGRPSVRPGIVTYIYGSEMLKDKNRNSLLIKNTQLPINKFHDKIRGIYFEIFLFHTYTLNRQNQAVSLLLYRNSHRCTNKACYHYKLYHTT